MKGKGVEIFMEEILLIWKSFCELHNNLYKATCQEYQFLLEGRMDELDEHLKKKVDLISRIKNIEVKRKDLINRFFKTEQGTGITSISQLLLYMQSDQVDENYRDCFKKYNDLLVDIISQIQEQNKRNQHFLNKSIHNLRSIREGLLGQRPLAIYNATGKEQQLTAK